jgi:hypothetical protein
MVYFCSKNPKFVLLWKTLEVYLLPVGIFCGHVLIFGIFLRLVTLFVPRKSGSPGDHAHFLMMLYTFAPISFPGRGTALRKTLDFHYHQLVRCLYKRRLSKC